MPEADGRTGRQVKELLKREVQQSESELQRNAAIISDYKQVSRTPLPATVSRRRLWAVRVVYVHTCFADLF